MSRTASIFAVLTIAGFALRAQAQERIATNNTHNEFPRWTMLANASNVKDGSGNRVFPGQISMAQDPKNVLHIAGTLPVSGGGNQVYWVNNAWLTRRGNGFSAPYQVSSAGSGYSCHDVEVAALTDNSVVILWVEPQSGGTENVKYRTWSTSSGWGSVTTGITGASGETFTQLRTTSRGTAIHMVFVRTNGSSVKLEYVNPTTSWTTTVVSDKAATSASAAGANVAVDGSGNLFFVYEDYPTGGGEYARYRTKPSGSSVSSATDIAQDGYSPDVALDSGGTAHIVYVKGSGANSGKVYHRVAIGGSDTHVGNTTAATAAFDRSRIVLDTRDRPNVMWSANGDVGYAVKVGSSWTRQEPVQEPGRGNTGSGRGTNSWSFGPLDIVINPFDGVSWIDSTSGLVSGMYEPNLGSQDSTAEFAMGPGATANGTTGNLNFRLPLFSSKGVGFATSLALLHNSLEADWGVMSNGWSHSYHMYLIDGATGYNNNQDSVTVVFADGSRAIFRYSATYGYLVADSEYGVFSKLERLTSSSSTEWVYSAYRLTTKYGVQYDFREDGKLENITDTNSNTMDFHYAGDSGYTPDSTHPSGALWKIEDSTKNLGGTQSGRMTTFNYNSDLKLASVQDPKSGSATYTIAYSSGRVSTVSFTGESGITWTFSYHSTNHTSNGYRIGLLSLVKTPRGTAAGTPYGNAYEWQQDNRFRATVDPAVTVITNCSADATPVSDSPVHELEYTDPTGGSFSTPNQNAPGSNTVPIVTYSDPCGRTTTLEYQARRAIVDNLTDPLDNHFILTHDGTYRNVTAFTSKRGYTTAYTFQSTNYPSHVKDNLWKIERPNAAGTGYLSPITYTYTTNNLNRVASFTDAKGNATSYGYDSAGNLTSITYPTTTLVNGNTQNGSVSYTYTTRGRVDTFTDSEGGVTDYDYSDNSTGLLTEVRLNGQSAGNGFARTYDDLGNLETWVNADNNLSGGTWTYAYDGLHRLETITDPASEVDTFGYDADSNFTSHQDRRGNSKTYSYDARNQLASVTIPITTSTTATANYTYDREGHLRRDTNFRGYTTVYLYDELGRVEFVSIPGGGTTGSGSSSSLVHEFTYQYDDDDNVTEVRAEGTVDRVTTYTFDARGNRTGVTLPITSHTKTLIYDDNDNLLAVNSYESSTFRSGFARTVDQQDRVTKSYELTAAYSSGTPTGYFRAFLYDEDSRVVQVWNGRASSYGTANSVAYDYNARGQLISVTNGDGNIIRELDYYEDGSIEEVRARGANPASLVPVSNYEYTTRGLVSEWTDALSNSETYTYDDNENLLTLTDRRGVVTTYAYFPSNRVSSVSRAVTVPTTRTIARSFTYDENGNAVTLTMFNPATGSNNAVYTWAWDKADRPEKYTTPNSNHNLVYTYNGFGELATKADFNGVTVTYSYDSLGRLSTEAHGTPHNTTVTYSSYYADTKLATDFDDGMQRIIRTYNVRLLLTQEEWRVNSVSFKTVSYGHDGARNITSMTDPENASIAYAYDNDNRIYTATRTAPLGSPVVHATATYDAGGRKSNLLYADGTQINWTYTNRSQIASAAMSGLPGLVTDGFSYQYDARGQCTQQVRINFAETVTWTYDDMGLKLTEGSTGSGTNSPVFIPWRSITWAHDDANNTTSMVRSDAPQLNPVVTTVTYSYDNENNLTTEAISGSWTWNYQYDANGNRTQRAQSLTNGVVETFAYDFMDRLSSYVRVTGAGGSNVLASTTYSYMPTAQSLRMSDLAAGTSMWTMHDIAGVSTRYTQTGTGALTLWSSFVNNTIMWECHILVRVDTLPAAANVYNLQDIGCHDPVTGAAGSQPGIPLPNAPQWPQGNTCCPTLPTSPDINHWIGYHASNPTGTFDPPQETGSGGPTPAASPSKSNITIHNNGSLSDAALGHRITPEAIGTVTYGGSSHYANRGSDGYGVQEPAKADPCPMGDANYRIPTAIVEALKKAWKLTSQSDSWSRREWGGSVIEDKSGRETATEPHMGEKESMDVSEFPKADSSKGETRTGTYHTHPHQKSTPTGAPSGADMSVLQNGEMGKALYVQSGDTLYVIFVCDVDKARAAGNLSQKYDRAYKAAKGTHKEKTEQAMKAALKDSGMKGYSGSSSSAGKDSVVTATPMK